MTRDLFAAPPHLPPRSSWQRECCACGACCVAPDIAALAKPLHTPCAQLYAAPHGQQLCRAYDSRPAVCRGYAPDWVCGEVAPLPTLEARSRRLLELYGLWDEAQGATLDL